MGRDIAIHDQRIERNGHFQAILKEKKIELDLAISYMMKSYKL